MEEKHKIVVFIAKIYSALSELGPYELRESRLSE
jgi:hypothetical protein